MAGRRAFTDLVGVGLVIMLSSMLVATMQGLPRLRHPCTQAVLQAVLGNPALTPRLRHPCTQAVLQAVLGNPALTPRLRHPCIQAVLQEALGNPALTPTTPGLWGG